MGITKQPLNPPFDNEPKLSRKEEIEVALEQVDNLSPAQLAEFAVKLNLAAANGVIQLTSQEHTALKTISQKCIPDAPKQINLNANIKTEQIILGWCETNTTLRDETNVRIKEQSAIELESLAGLDGFRDSFAITGEEESDG